MYGSPRKKTSRELIRGNNTTGQLRMSGEALAALKSKPQEEPLGPAYEALLDKVEQMNVADNMLQDAGIPASEFNGLQRLQVPQLQGGVPAPYVQQVGNNERRIHLLEENGELYPVANNNPDTGPYLITDYGRNVDMEGQTKASEYVQDHILRLMGHEPVRGPKGKVDFLVEGADGRTIGIDGQTSRVGWNPQVQAYAKILPTRRQADGGGYGYGYSRNRDNSRANETAMIKDVQKLLEITEMEKYGLQRAMNSGIERGYVMNDRALPGKVHRQNYDEVLMPVLTREDHLANKARDDMPAAPVGIVSYNMPEVRDAVNQLKDPSKMNIAYNAGNDQRGKLRGQITVDVPGGAINDVTVSHPYTQQMLRQLPYA